MAEPINITDLILKNFAEAQRLQTVAAATGADNADNLDEEAKARAAKLQQDAAQASDADTRARADTLAAITKAGGAGEDVTNQIYDAMGIARPTIGQSGNGSGVGVSGRSGGGSKLVDLGEEYSAISSAINQAQADYDAAAAAQQQVVNSASRVQNELDRNATQAAAYLNAQRTQQLRVELPAKQINDRYAADLLEQNSEDLEVYRTNMADLDRRLKDAYALQDKLKKESTEAGAGIRFWGAKSTIDQLADATAEITSLQTAKEKLTGIMQANQAITTTQITLGSANAKQIRAQNASIDALVTNAKINSELAAADLEEVAKSYGIDKDKLTAAINKAGLSKGTASLNISAIKSVAMASQAAVINGNYKKQQDRTRMYEQGIIRWGLASNTNIMHVPEVASLLAEGTEQSIALASNILGQDGLAFVLNATVRAPGLDQVTRIGDVGGTLNSKTLSDIPAVRSAKEVLTDILSANSSTISDRAATKAGAAWANMTSSDQAKAVEAARLDYANNLSAVDIANGAVFSSGTNKVTPSLARPETAQALLDAGVPPDVVKTIVADTPSNLAGGTAADKSAFSADVLEFFTNAVRPRTTLADADKTGRLSISSLTPEQLALVFTVLDTQVAKSMQAAAERNYPELGVSMPSVDLSKISLQGKLPTFANPNQSMFSSRIPVQYKPGAGIQGNLEFFNALKLVASSVGK